MTSQTTTISIPARFCGPVASANGGYASGLLAGFIDGPASVTLKAPPPLETPLTVERIEPGKSVRLMHGKQEIATATSTSLEVTPPPIPTQEDLKAARKSYLDGAPRHPLPGCFVCGPGRHEGDGLRIFAGATPNSSVNADIWVPGNDLADEEGLVRKEFLWAAMDCPSAWATRIPLHNKLILLGRLSADIRLRPKPGDKLTIAAWPVDTDGRKHFSNVVVFDENTEIIAIASAIWIEVTDPKFLKYLKTGK